MGIYLHQLSALFPNLESCHMKMGELEFSLYGNTTCTETDIPERMAVLQFQGS